MSTKTKAADYTPPPHQQVPLEWNTTENVQRLARSPLADSAWLAAGSMPDTVGSYIDTDSDFTSRAVGLYNPAEKRLSLSPAIDRFDPKEQIAPGSSKQWTDPNQVHQEYVVWPGAKAFPNVRKGSVLDNLDVAVPTGPSFGMTYYGEESSPRMTFLHEVGHHADHSRDNPAPDTEQWADRWRAAFEFLSNTARDTTGAGNKLQEIEAMMPGTRVLVDTMLERPIFREHPLNQRPIKTTDDALRRLFITGFPDSRLARALKISRK